MERTAVVQGSVMDEDVLRDDILQTSRVCFWNNYGGWWEKVRVDMADGSKPRLQDAVRERLFTMMKPGSAVHEKLTATHTHTHTSVADTRHTARNIQVALW